MIEPENDNWLEPEFDPQSRFDKLDDVEPEFWKHKKLEQMNKREWELLCDGCGKCCLNKLEIRGKIKFTNTYCRFLDCHSCLCKIYEHRFKQVPDCRDYWLLDNGFELPDWHPLITRRAASVHEAAMSLQGRKLVCETGVDDYENYLVHWSDL